MDSSASSNAMIQDNYEGPMRKNIIHMQRKNYRSEWKHRRKTTA